MPHLPGVGDADLGVAGGKGRIEFQAQKIVASGLVSVIRAENPDQAAHIAEACALGGVAVQLCDRRPGSARR
ncbi:MAG: hypothetical protein ABSE74_06850, partial [Methanoregula sp.]